jgi:hypothetical protein
VKNTDEFVNMARENAKVAQKTIAETWARGAEQARPLVADLAENARKVVHAAAKAVSEATAPKPPAGPPSSG